MLVCMYIYIYTDVCSGTAQRSAAQYGTAHCPDTALGVLGVLGVPCRACDMAIWAGLPLA
jgi:hypothetical protein